MKTKDQARKRDKKKWSELYKVKRNKGGRGQGVDVDLKNVFVKNV